MLVKVILWLTYLYVNNFLPESSHNFQLESLPKPTLSTDLSITVAPFSMSQLIARVNHMIQWCGNYDYSNSNDNNISLHVITHWEHIISLMVVNYRNILSNVADVLLFVVYDVYWSTFTVWLRFIDGRLWICKIFRKGEDIFTSYLCYYLD